MHHSLVVTLAGVAELVDAHDSKSCILGCVGSSPTSGTLIILFGRRSKRERSRSRWDLKAGAVYKTSAASACREHEVTCDQVPAPAHNAFVAKLVSYYLPISEYSQIAGTTQNRVSSGCSGSIPTSDTNRKTA